GRHGQTRGRTGHRRVRVLACEPEVLGLGLVIFALDGAGGDAVDCLFDFLTDVIGDLVADVDLGALAETDRVIAVGGAVLVFIGDFRQGVGEVVENGGGVVVGSVLGLIGVFNGDTRIASVGFDNGLERADVTQVQL